MVFYYEPECLVKQKWIAMFKVKVTVKVQIFTGSLLVLFFRTTDLFATKLGVLIYYY